MFVGTPLRQKTFIILARRRMLCAETRQHFPCFLPGAFHNTQKGRMPAPRIFLQCLKATHQTSSQWIEVNITHQLKEVGIFFTNNRFITILKQVPDTFIPIIERHGIARHQPPH